MIKQTLALIGLSLSISLSAQAAPLGLVLEDTPDILVQGMTVSYDSATLELSAAGFAVQLDAPPGETITSGTFDLNATVDNAGILLGGTVTIGGTIPNLGYNSGTLLTGSLTQFGFNPGGGDPLEFVFDITGGDAAAIYLAVRSVGGIVMTLTDFPGGFDSDWTSQASVAQADVAPVPVPAAAWLFGSALLGLTAVKRKKAQ